MPQQNPPSKHHYIPAFYLSRWESVPDEKLTEFTRPYGPNVQSKRVKAESTGFQVRLYSLKGYEPEEAQQVEENFFKPIDNEAAKVLGILERSGHYASWNSRSRSAWTRFIVSLLLRCPEDIEHFRSWTRDKIFENPGAMAEMKYAHVRGAEHPETFSEFLRAQPTAMKERFQYQTLINLIDHASVGTIINQMEWRVWKSPNTAPAFLTSDRPVIRTSSLKGERAHIALPIGPRLLFIASPDMDFLASFLVADPVKLAKEANRQIVEGAQCFVYGCDDTQLRFIENRFGKNPQPRLTTTIFREKLDDTSADNLP